MYLGYLESIWICVWAHYFAPKALLYFGGDLIICLPLSLDHHGLPMHRLSTISARPASMFLSRHHQPSRYYEPVHQPTSCSDDNDRQQYVKATQASYLRCSWISLRNIPRSRSSIWLMIVEQSRIRHIGKSRGMIRAIDTTH
jgi:hypothetical protein